MARSVTKKICAILDAVAEAPDGLTASGLGRRVGMPLSTAHRLAGELVDQRVLERDDTGRYRIGLSLWEIATAAPQPRALREVARPILDDLHRTVGQIVQLAISDRDTALVVEQLAPLDAIRIASRVGGRLPLHASGVGQALLAWSPHTDQDRAVARPLVRFTDQTAADASTLRRALSDARSRGVARVSRSMPMPATAYAAPVIGPGGALVAALGVVMPVGSGRATAHAHVLLGSARRLSRCLGGAPASGAGRADHTRTCAVDSGTNRSPTS